MSPEDIARAFVACSGFAWVVGMVDADGCRYVGDTDDGMRLWQQGAIVARCKRSVVSVPDTEDKPTLAIIAHVLLPKRWPGHSVQVETFPDGTARVLVFDASLHSHHPQACVFAVSHEPVAESLLACLQAAPGEAAS